LEATLLEAMVDKDVDVDKGVDMAAARPHLLWAVHPLSWLLWQGEYQHFWECTWQQAVDILHPHPQGMSKPRHIRTSRRGLPTGMHVIPVGSTWPMATPARRAPYIWGSQIMKNASRDKMPSNTSMWGMDAAQKCTTRWCF
jgi:hypothetical protein